MYALIWHAQDNESSSRPNIMTLLCLNAGKFNSDKDDEFRLSLIDSHSDDYSLNLTISVYASHGLRFSKPDTALNLLVDFATNNLGPRNTILVLTAEYQDEHLLPHIQNLTRIYKNFNLNYVPKQILEAHNRIFSLTAK